MLEMISRSKILVYLRIINREFKIELMNFKVLLTKKGKKYKGISGLDELLKKPLGRRFVSVFIFFVLVC